MTTAGTHELLTDIPSFSVFDPGPLESGNGQVGRLGPSESLCRIPAQQSWDDLWVLLDDLFVNIHTSPEEVLAIAYLTVQEYGVGPSFEQAIADLLTSLSDYYLALEARQARLEPSAERDLKLLRKLVGRKPIS